MTAPEDDTSLARGSNSAQRAARGNAAADEGSRAGALSSAQRIDSLAPPAEAAALRYLRGGELGRGGMGVVEAAFDPVLERNVALKRPLQSNPEGEAWLAREARLTARLDHPAIAAVLDLGRDDEGRLSAVLPVRQGRSLAQAVQDHPASAPAPALLRALLVASQAVAHAHARGVLHRDLSPANVRLGEDGAVWVFDWGLAATLAEAAGGGFTGGTAGYSSPEQREGRPGTCASDVWSLGALLHLVCARAPPGEAPVQPRGCPPALWAVCRKALCAAPAARYPDAVAFAAELSRWLDGLPVEAWPEGLLARAARVARRQPRLTASLAAGVGGSLLAIAIAAVVAAAAQQRATHATASLLLDSAERALNLDDVRGTRQLAGEALRALESPRARGLLAAVARVPEVKVTRVSVACREVDAFGALRLCADDGALTLARPGGPALALGAGELGAVLASGQVVTASMQPGRVRVFDAAGKLSAELDLGGGRAELRTDPARTVAVVAVSDGLIHFAGTLRAVSPCTPSQPLRFAAPAADQTEVLCGDDELVKLDGQGQVLARRHPLGLGTLLRGAVAGDFVDARTLLLGTASGQVGLLSLEPAEVLRVVPTGLGLLGSVVASRDGRAAVLVGERGLGVWRVKEGHLIPLELPPLDGVRPEGEGGFLAQGPSGAWRLSVIERLSLATDLHGRSGLAVHEATRRLAVGDALGRVELFSLDTGLLEVIEGPVRVIKSVAFSPSGRWLALGAAGPEGALVYDTSVSPAVRARGDFEGLDLRGRHVAFLGEDTLLVFGWGHWAWRARYEAGAFRAHEGLEFPSDVRSVATRGDELRVLDAEGGWHSLSARDGAVVVRELARWTPVPRVVAASPDLSAVATALDSMVMRGSQRFEVPAPVEALALAADGRLAVCRRDGVVELRARDDVPLLEVRAHEARCSGVRFCDHERALCSIGWDGRLRVIELR